MRYAYTFLKALSANLTLYREVSDRMMSLASGRRSPGSSFALTRAGSMLLMGSPRLGTARGRRGEQHVRSRYFWR
jgi:hypothetical protein